MKLYKLKREHDADHLLNTGISGMPLYHDLPYEYDWLQTARSYSPPTIERLFDFIGEGPLAIGEVEEISQLQVKAMELHGWICGPVCKAFDWTRGNVVGGWDGGEAQGVDQLVSPLLETLLDAALQLHVWKWKVPAVERLNKRDVLAFLNRLIA